MPDVWEQDGRGTAMRMIDKDALLKELGITDEECEKCDRGDGSGYCTMSSDWTYVCDAICTAPVIDTEGRQ